MKTMEDQQNRKFILIASFAIPIQLIIFKLLYPYAGFINWDSYSYLQAASSNANINIFPIGYSKFLRIFKVFTTADTALVCFQYLLIELSALWMLFSLFKFFNPGNLARRTMFLIVVFNPALLYISNYISSDALFLALSILWFTSMLWILYRPDFKFIVFELVLLLAAFTVRYNALYYPLVATFGLSLSEQSIKRRILAIIANFLIVVIFIKYTTIQYRNLTGVGQFTPFSGWQIANNALGGYRYIDSQNLKPVPPLFQHLDRMVHLYFETSQRNSFDDNVDNTHYMWDLDGPLQQFMKMKFRNDSKTDKLTRWASMAPLYGAYGWLLVREYPKCYLRYYILPNLQSFYAPPVEFLGCYNMGIDTVDKSAVLWFRYKGNQVRSAFRSYNVSILKFHPAFFGLMNGLYLLGLIYGLLYGFFHDKPLLGRIMATTFVLWIANFCFSIVVSPITLRYQLFPMLLFSSLAIILVDRTFKNNS